MAVTLLIRYFHTPYADTTLELLMAAADAESRAATYAAVRI